GLEVGKGYVFTVEVMEVEDNYGEDYPPPLFLQVLGTSQATAPAGPAWDYSEYTIEFFAEATTHHVALLTDASWATGAGNQPALFALWMRGLSLMDAPPTLQAAFIVPAPTLTGELEGEDLWGEPEPEDPEEGGDEDPPEPPDPRDLPSSIPDETYIALLDEN